ncbi:hypothetical protein QYM36_012258 [Artemia franciscana]|uniref:F-box domain-containing protein n=1 Tax=Artemia franciscana TaxID=6661 RepID=A0AA88L384_ARTSF|nr:hypothetical protein QYM36_012258 [Artemia franciscana]
MLEELPWDTIEMICHYLSLRDLSHLRLVSNSCRDIVISYYSRMKFIQASKLRSTSNRTFEKELKFVLNHCGNLRVAILSGCNFLSDDVVISVLSRNPNLRVLDLSNCSRLKSAALQPLVNKLQNLKKLYLSKCSWVTPGVIECIAMKRRELEVLDLSSCMSSSATKTDNGIEFSPLRSLNDFLLESGRFQVPNLKDFEKWGKMVVQNLLYYQTNYFILGLVIFTIVGVIHPTQMFVGLISFALVVAGFSHASDAHSQITSFKQSHPLICLAIFLAVLYLLFQFVGSLLVFLLGILLPIADVNNGFGKISTSVRPVIRRKEPAPSLPNKILKMTIKT